METYRARGKKRVDAIIAAIEASGGTVLSRPDPSSAPFVFDVRLADGAPLRIICYAFTATKYLQGGRPSDEHRFQVKYSNKFDRPHKLHVDPKNSVTLFFGVYEDGSLFVAADPAVHNPTWFSSSVEFKEADVDLARRRGWHGWERDRVAHGRRRVNADDSLVTETLHGFLPEHFLTYALFERVATGMDPGERLILVNDLGNDLRNGRGARSLIDRQAEARLPDVDRLLATLGLPIDDLLIMVAGNPRLLTAIRGGVAERHLQSALANVRGITHLKKLSLDGQPDFVFRFGRRDLRLECKLVSPHLTRGLPRVDFQKTRASKADPCSRYYASSQFELLAACMQPVTARWEFRYALTAALPPHKKCPSKITDRILVEPGWPGELVTLLS